MEKIEQLEETIESLRQRLEQADTGSQAGASSGGKHTIIANSNSKVKPQVQLHLNSPTGLKEFFSPMAKEISMTTPSKNMSGISSDQATPKGGEDLDDQLHAMLEQKKMMRSETMKMRQNEINRKLVEEASYASE